MQDPRVSWPHPSDTKRVRGHGPAGISPSARFPVSPRAPTASWARDEPNCTHCTAYCAPELAHRRAWRTRRRCSPRPGQLRAVEHEPRAGKEARGRGETNALGITAHGGEERENHMSSNGRAGLIESNWACARGAGRRGGVVGGCGFKGGGRSYKGVELWASAIMARGGTDCWCCERERAREGEWTGANERGGRGGSGGGTWWPTRAHRGATRRRSSTGSPWRHGAAGHRARARWGRRVRSRAGPASASGPEARRQPAGAPLSPSLFFEILFPNHFPISFWLI